MWGSIAATISALACASTPAAGPLADGSTAVPRITAVDTTRPPRSAWVQLDQQAYAVLVLVAPGHSATLLYPVDSSIDNHLSAGAHQLSFSLPGMMVLDDTARNPDRSRRTQRDSSLRYPGGVGPSSRTRTYPPLEPATPTFLLLVTSPQPLVYRRVVEKTAGVSIPSMETEALNAVAKAIKATLVTEPREWAGYYQRVELRRQR
ncbi:MAG TPA: hypothetical protein VKH19_11505 [Gemmatimonadaceae bacterium]|nr:hypothetical protein [Gemmatimonadaceae bacterium]